MEHDWQVTPGGNDWRFDESADVVHGRFVMDDGKELVLALKKDDTPMPAMLSKVDMWLGKKKDEAEGIDTMLRVALNMAAEIGKDRAWAEELAQASRDMNKEKLSELLA